MRSGVLCAAVEAKQKNARSLSVNRWTTRHDATRKSRRLSYESLRYSFQNDALLPLLMHEKSSRQQPRRRSFFC
ncbi:hypothetical protein KIN20_033173 [Parelaphostrongylus tenuis]|uniref:Uncharacterized protein n=1 Tax=Parelaphostrongylus tenuis TaxID=148309 RepID=A0AAD5R810_PARTN|nr:hypothetical protein KIN20_033173 [Parelaphostrongylus tenuis]